MKDKPASFEPGTAVVVAVGSSGAYYLTSIVRQTKSQIEVERPPKRKFMKDSQRQLGHAGEWYPTTFHTANERFLEYVSQYNERRRRNNMLSEMTHARLGELSTPQLENILAIINTQPPQ